MKRLRKRRRKNCASSASAGTRRESSSKLMSGAKVCLPYVNGKRWLPRLWELTADDWVTCSQPEEPEIRRDPEPVRKKPDAIRIAAIVTSCVSLLVSLAVLLLT